MHLIVLICAMLLGSSISVRAHFTVNAYLKEVTTRHTGYRSSLEKSLASELKSQEGSHLLSPHFFLNLQTLTDQRLTRNPSIQGSKTVFNGYALGLSQNTSFGLQAKLSYNLNYTSISGASAAFVPTALYYDGQPSIEITQSLWSNSFGSSIRAQRDSLEAMALANQFNEHFQQSLIQADAEILYWKLSLARLALSVYQSAYDRTVYFQQWLKKRVSMNLQDHSDLLQANAVLEMRRLELQSAFDEERSICLAFNALRGLNSNEVLEDLEKPDQTVIESLPVPKRMSMRSNLKMAEQISKMTTANAIVSRHRLLPTLDLFANYSLNGHHAELKTTISDSIKTNHPVWAVGLKFNTPLDFWTTSDLREAAVKEQVASELFYDRKKFEELQQWQDLNIKFENIKKRLLLSRSIEAIQKEKWIYEKNRFERGRSTTYQVLMFEHDYAQAEINRIKTSAELLSIYAQLKSFGEFQ